MVIITAEGANNTAGDGGLDSIRFGTGTPPTNGAAPTGTAIGNQQSMISSAVGAKECLTVIGLAPTLVPGTQYWFDLIEAAITGGTFSLTNVRIMIVEF